jgi:hypothetical protein
MKALIAWLRADYNIDWVLIVLFWPVLFLIDWLAS